MRIESSELLWVGEHVHYNFKTHVMTSEQFRTGFVPIFAAGEALSGNSTNRVNEAHHAYITTDDFSDPEYEVRASTIRIIPGK